MNGPFLKICGITRLPDALHAVECGATALGFVLWPRSPRYIAPRAVARIVSELPRSVTTVGVFVNEPVDSLVEATNQAGLMAVQLHGDEPATYAATLRWPILRSVTLDTAAAVCASWPLETTLLMDAADPERRGGTGVKSDWMRAADLARTHRLVLAGGLTADNVAAAITDVRPFGVDVSSGVEDAPGVKSPEKVARFLACAREAMDGRAS